MKTKICNLAYDMFAYFNFRLFDWNGVIIEMLAYTVSFKIYGLLYARSCVLFVKMGDNSVTNQILIVLL